MTAMPSAVVEPLAEPLRVRLPDGGRRVVIRAVPDAARPLESVAMAINAARHARYPALYEVVDAREAKDLEEVTSAIIAAVGDPQTDDRAWRRMGFIALAILVEVMPTIGAHWPRGLDEAGRVCSALKAWLTSSTAPVPIETMRNPPIAPQALGEALNVTENAARLLKREHARDAVTEILDSAFQGYAIFPGSEGRRALFDWWLDRALPAALELRTAPRLDRRAR